MSTQPQPGTRAVIRGIDAGSSASCVTCDQQVKFSAKTKRYQVIANVYVAGRWNRVEHYHFECYVEIGSPHGVLDPSNVPAPRRVQQLQAVNASSNQAAESAA